MSPAAWNWAWDLVSPEKKPEVQFFGASTLSIKLSKFYHEVPAEQVGFGGTLTSSDLSSSLVEL